jgi:hypothetical protein
MNRIATVTGLILGAGIFALTSCSMQEEKPAKPAAMPAASARTSKAAPMAKAPAKVKAQKASGNIGLLDTEKNYLILVTSKGKLVTLDFDGKTKVTKFTPAPSKVADIGLGNAAVVTYTTQGSKNVASSVVYKTKK